MKKSHKHTELSDFQCEHPGCRKQIKQRLREKKNPNTLCYKHFAEKEAKRNHFVGHLGKPREKRLDDGLPVKEYA